MKTTAASALRGADEALRLSETAAADAAEARSVKSTYMREHAYDYVYTAFGVQGPFGLIGGSRRTRGPI